MYRWYIHIYKYGNERTHKHAYMHTRKHAGACTMHVNSMHAHHIHMHVSTHTQTLTTGGSHRDQKHALHSGTCLGATQVHLCVVHRLNTYMHARPRIPSAAVQCCVLGLTCCHGMYSAKVANTHARSKCYLGALTLKEPLADLSRLSSGPPASIVSSNSSPSSRLREAVGVPAAWSSVCCGEGPCTTTASAPTNSSALSHICCAVVCVCVCV